jgi:hypothetical protein
VIFIGDFLLPLVNASQFGCVVSKFGKSDFSGRHLIVCTPKGPESKSWG